MFCRHNRTTLQQHQYFLANMNAYWTTKMFNLFFLCFSHRHQYSFQLFCLFLINSNAHSSSFIRFWSTLLHYDQQKYLENNTNAGQFPRMSNLIECRPVSRSINQKKYYIYYHLKNVDYVSVILFFCFLVCGRVDISTIWQWQFLRWQCKHLFQVAFPIKMFSIILKSTLYTVKIIKIIAM